VFSARIASDIHQTAADFSEAVIIQEPTILLDPDSRKVLQESMSRGAGVLRSKKSLLDTEGVLEKVGTQSSLLPCVEAWETTNLYQLAQVIVRSALTREETRGSHWREDFPDQNKTWLKRILQHLDSQGKWSTKFQEVIKK
jgi:L-aspartate oxidase